ncbi:MAG: hypothetical protein H7333_02140 [Bdellovibrionales bacterium]|nr:hypothetical protein [Oligoflexia bacterium]
MRNPSKLEAVSAQFIKAALLGAREKTIRTLEVKINHPNPPFGALFKDRL